MEKIKKYIKKNYTNFTVLFFIGAACMFIQNLPYINLFISPVWYWVFLLTVAVLLLKVTTKSLALFAIFLLIISFPWVLIGSRVAVENLGILVFFSMLLIIIKEILLIRK